MMLVCYRHTFFYFMAFTNSVSGCVFMIHLFHFLRVLLWVWLCAEFVLEFLYFCEK